jgi:hypothetical protein
MRFQWSVPTQRFVVVSGLPGSGKTTLAGQLASPFKLPVIDKDAILEELFEGRGVGDAAWRRSLSRESDALMRERAMASGGAILVSFWRLAGMAADSGTPTDWLRELDGSVVNVHCVCAPEIAAQRFLRRHRHPGHLDIERPYEDVLQSVRAIAKLGAVPCGSRIEVDTSGAVNVDEVAHQVRAATS